MFYKLGTLMAILSLLYAVYLIYDEIKENQGG